MDATPAPHRHAWRTSGESRARAVLVPTGAVEQHGPHLPLGTDVFLAGAIANAIAARRENVLAAEAIPYGCSWHHRGFPGTVSLRPASFIALVVDVCSSLAEDGALPILCNGHYGNKAALDVAVAELAANGVRAAAFTYLDQLTDLVREQIADPETAAGHACALETSLVAHLWPAAVRSAAIPAGGTPPNWPDPHLLGTDRVSVVRRFEELNPTGVVGRPEAASAEFGSMLFEAAVKRGGEIVDHLIAGYGGHGGAAGRQSSDPRLRRRT